MFHTRKFSPWSRYYKIQLYKFTSDGVNLNLSIERPQTINIVLPTGESPIGIAEFPLQEQKKILRSIHDVKMASGKHRSAKSSSMRITLGHLDWDLWLTFR